MSTKLKQLRALQARLEKATGLPMFAGEATDLACLLVTPGHPAFREMQLALTGGVEAVGAALALVERLLPGWKFKDITQHHDCWTLRLAKPDGAVFRGAATTHALAILRALVAALIVQAEADHV